MESGKSSDEEHYPQTTQIVTDKIRVLNCYNDYMHHLRKSFPALYFPWTLLISRRTFSSSVLPLVFTADPTWISRRPDASSSGASSSVIDPPAMTAIRPRASS